MGNLGRCAFLCTGVGGKERGTAEVRLTDRVGVVGGGGRVLLREAGLVEGGVRVGRSGSFLGNPPFDIIEERVIELLRDVRDMDMGCGLREDEIPDEVEGRPVCALARASKAASSGGVDCDRTHGCEMEGRGDGEDWGGVGSDLGEDWEYTLDDSARSWRLGEAYFAGNGGTGGASEVS